MDVMDTMFRRKKMLKHGDLKHEKKEFNSNLRHWWATLFLLPATKICNKVPVSLSVI
jgi:hypothetical protein